MFWNKYPYSNLHDLNLDWIVAKIKDQEETIKTFINVSTIKYADPIQWNITKQYEANTVVVDPATGVAYISTKPVPSGIALSNTDYWTVVFDLDALFSDLEQEMEDFKTDVNNDINDFKTDVNNEINDFNDEIDDINARIGALSEKYFIFIGDSFGAGWTNDGNVTPYGTLFKNLLQIQNDHWFETNVGGSGFVSGTTYLMQIQSLYSNIPDRSKITDIYVLGGRNDFGQTINDILSAKQTFINYCKVNYPNAIVHIGFIGRSFEYTTATTMAIQYNVYTAYKRFTEQYGANYIDGIEAFLNDSAMFASDRKHPNQDGHNSILSGLISYFRTGTSQYSNVIYPVLTPSGVNTGNSDFGSISMSESGEEITMIMFPVSITCNITGQSMNGYAAEIGTFNRLMCPGCAYNAYMSTGTAIVRYIENSVNKYREIPITLSINQNKLYVTISMINDAGNNYYNGTINEIQLKGIHLIYSGYRGE